MRAVLAALVDTLAVIVLGFIGFRLAVSAAPCSNLGDCAILTPVVLVAAVVLIAAYFLVGYLAWHRTPGDRLLG
jgi:hypothetical protein